MASLEAPSRRSGATQARLFLKINETLYGLRALPCDPEIAERAFRLDKPDGSRYDVSQTRYGPQCDCPDFIFRRDGLDPAGCKHVKALVAEGLIAGLRPSKATAERGTRGHRANNMGAGARAGLGHGVETL